MTRLGGGRSLIVAVVAGAVLLGLLAAAFATPADAAIELKGKQRTQLIKAAIASSGGRAAGLKMNAKGRVTMAPLYARGPAKIVAVRSSVNRRWALMVALLNGSAMQRQTFLLKRKGSRWKVEWSTTRGSESEAVCRHRQPGTAVILDLGLPAPSWGRDCRFKRKRAALVRRMTGAEVKSIRRMVEWTWGDGGLKPGPVQPRVADEFASSCSWDKRGPLDTAPTGEVARSNPRWGVLLITCVTGTDGFAELASTTVMLVRRPGRSGPFTQVLAHTGPSWSLRSGLCDRDIKWTIPAQPRAALEFCIPFPAKIRNALL